MNMKDGFENMGFTLLSNFTNNKYLTIDTQGDVSLKKSLSMTDDDVWHFVNVPLSSNKSEMVDVNNLDVDTKDENEYLIVSDMSSYMICYDPAKGGDVDIRPYSENTRGCFWKVSPSNQIYQDDRYKNGEQYLWTANDSLYVTNDGYLADEWYIEKASRKIEKFEFLDDSKDKVIVIVIAVLVFILILSLLN